MAFLVVHALRKFGHVGKIKSCHIEKGHRFMYWNQIMYQNAYKAKEFWEL